MNRTSVKSCLTRHVDEFPLGSHSHAVKASAVLWGRRNDSGRRFTSSRSNRARKSQYVAFVTALSMSIADQLTKLRPSIACTDLFQRQ